MTNTNNIVAQFSCSLDRSGNLIEYPVVSGSVFNEEYNETLDSGTLVLSQVPASKRLSYLKQYDFVRVYDKSGNTGFDKTYLVDNFNEVENNIYDHIFGYTINLMSETKLLEKMQCPNLASTHKVDDGVISKKTIYQNIKQYMDLYVPKLKTYNSDDNSWEYKPLIEIGVLSEGRTFQMTFNEDNCTLQGDEYEIIAYSDEIDNTFPNIAIDTIDVIDFTTTTQPVVIIVDKKVSVDESLRRFKFHGLIQDIPYSSVDDSVEIMFTPDSFVQQGNYYELNISSEEFDDKFDLSRFTINDYTVETDPETQLSSINITMDENSRRIVVYAESAQLCSGSFTINYTTFKKSLSGIVNINFKASTKGNDFYQRFNYPCADLPFNTPTLRQLLTMLMQQVGCIPVVKDRKLGYLDFQKDAIPFGGDKGFDVNKTVNKITRAASSDSYVNTLVNMSSGVLDSSNLVYTESLGFRDKNNVLLKQTQNLTLETRFPIYRVQNFVINGYVEGRLTIRNIHSTMRVPVPGENENDEFLAWNFIGTFENGKLKLNLNMQITGTHGYFRIDAHIVIFKYDYSNVQVRTLYDYIPADEYVSGESGVYEFSGTQDNDLFYMYGRVYVSNLDGTQDEFGYDLFHSNFTKQSALVLSLYSQDITPLLVENSIRANLDRDFREAAGQITIPNLSHYVYGTVGYSIGSTKITGFSEVFNTGEKTKTGWIQSEYTYIENIWNMIINNYKDPIKANFKQMFANPPVVKNATYRNDEEIDPGNVESFVFEDDAVPFNPMFDNNQGLTEMDDFRWLYTNINFGYLWFDITYQPLNSFNLSYVKSQEPVDFALEQYDGNASGLTDFDRLSIHEQEQVDRVGNETLSISQRTTTINDIQTFENGPLYYMDDTNRSGSIDNNDKGIKYIIFKKSFSIKNNVFNVSYVGSKDAILKDYFTSIRTKYRAYSYVDYSQSTLRKEKDVLFVRISEDGYYDGDDKIFFGDFSSYNITHQKELMSRLICNDNSIFNGIRNCILENENVKTKNDVSVIANKNTIGVIYEEYDNVGSGILIPNSSFDQSIDASDFLIGGIPQVWQIWDESYNEKHIVSFINSINLNDIFETYVEVTDGSKEEVKRKMNNILSLPIIQNPSLLTDKTVFSIVNNNKEINLDNLDGRERIFYKDYSEQVNHTIQFIYYTESKNILFGEEFLKLGNDFYGNFVDLTNKEFKLEPDQYLREFFDGRTVNVSTFLRIVANGTSNPYIEVNWDSEVLQGVTQFKLAKAFLTPHPKNDRFLDYLAIRKNGDEAIQKFYITLNDTKSDYVLTDKNGVLYRAYKVKTYKDGDTDEGRKVISLFNNNEGE